MSDATWYVSVVTDTNPEYRAMHTRLRADLYGRVADYAARTHRSLTNAVVHLLTVGLSVEEDRALIGELTARRLGKTI